MAKNVKDAIVEKIEIVDQKELHERKGFKAWLLIPLVLLLVGATSFVLVRRFLSQGE